MSKPLADYVQLPKLDEYKEWFKDFADLYREDGILQVTWKTLNGPMQHSGMSHRGYQPAHPLAEYGLGERNYHFHPHRRQLDDRVDPKAGRPTPSCPPSDSSTSTLTTPT